MICWGTLFSDESLATRAAAGVTAGVKTELFCESSTIQAESHRKEKTAESLTVF